ISPPALPGAKFLIGGVRHDSEQPRAEGGLAPETIDLPDHGPECILDDFFRVLPISRDPCGKTIGAVPICDDKTLGCGWLALAEGPQQFRIPIPLRWHVNLPALAKARVLLYEQHSHRPRPPSMSRFDFL